MTLFMERPCLSSAHPSVCMSLLRESVGNSCVPGLQEISTATTSRPPNPHLSECMPPEMSEHAALNMSLCSLGVVYSTLSDACALWSKGSWPRSHSLVCHLALFDQKEAVKHQVKTHLLPLLTLTACLLLPWPPNTHINTPKC